MLDEVKDVVLNREAFIKGVSAGMAAARIGLPPPVGQRNLPVGTKVAVAPNFTVDGRRCRPAPP